MRVFVAFCRGGVVGSFGVIFTVIVMVMVMVAALVSMMVTVAVSVFAMFRV